MSFEENIKKWVDLDTDIKSLSLKIKYLRDQKQIYNNNIIKYITEKQLSKATIKISDGKLKFVNVNYPQPLTYKFLFICLTKFIKDEKKISEIINFIKSEREIKSITEIKRS